MSLKSRRVDFLCYPSADLDWMLEPLLDAGVKVGAVHLVRFRPTVGEFTTRYSGFEILDENDYELTKQRINRDMPDILISSVMDRGGIKCRTVRTCSEYLTHKAAVNFLDYIGKMVYSHPEEGWRTWRR